MFKYRIADLDYIYIRVQRNGHWGNANLNELSDKEFVNWATEKFGIEIKEDAEATGTPWTLEQKVDFLNDMSERYGKPVVTMIKYDGWEKDHPEHNVPFENNQL